MEGSECRAVGRGGSLSSPEALRDSGGDRMPPSEAGTALAGIDWWLLCKCEGAAAEYGCKGLDMAAEDCLLW